MYPSLYVYSLSFTRHHFLSSFPTMVTLPFRFRDAYIKSTREVLSSLVSVTKPHNMAFLTQKASRQGMGSTSMDHLSCFYPGMLALGVMNEVLPEARSMAQNLTHTCYYMYNITTPTHLAPEIFRLNVRPGNEDVLRSNVSSRILSCFFFVFCCFFVCLFVCFCYTHMKFNYLIIWSFFLKQ